MAKLEDLIKTVYAEIEEQKAQLSQKIEATQKKLDKNVAKEAELDKREAELIEKEKLITARENDVELRWGKIRHDDEIKAQYEAILKKEEKFKKDNKGLIDLNAECTMKLQKIAQKEQDLSVREANYKEEIRKSFSDKIIGLN